MRKVASLGIAIFIDGTGQPILRPRTSVPEKHFDAEVLETLAEHPDLIQQLNWSGKDREHCLRWEGALAPDGLLVHLGGPQEGKRHDMGMLKHCELLKAMNDVKFFKDSRTGEIIVYIYGDQGYSTGDFLIAPYRGTALLSSDDFQKIFNRLMSAIRQPNEWIFGNVKNIWHGVGYRKKNSIFKGFVQQRFELAVLLTNIANCYRPNQTSQYFELSPPSAKDYLENLRSHV